MKIFQFDALVGREIPFFDSQQIIMTRILEQHVPEGRLHVGCMHFGAGGVCGYHQASTNQLFVVVQGSGWVRGQDSEHVPISTGQLAFWEQGEWHESGTDSDMTVMIIEGETLTPRPLYTTLLVKPSLAYKESFLEALKEYQAEGRYSHIDYEAVSKKFSTYLQWLEDDADPTKIAPDWVTASHFWLIDNGEFVGRVSVRHELNDFLLKVAGHIGYDIRPSKRNQGYGTKILEFVLPEAQRLGLDRVLVTCDNDNIGSKKIIEKNGGIFENELFTEGQPKPKLRYWLNTKVTS